MGRRHIEFAVEFLLREAGDVRQFLAQHAREQGRRDLSDQRFGFLQQRRAAFRRTAIHTRRQFADENPWSAQSSLAVGTATNLAGGTTGAVPYQTGAGATSFLSLGTTNYVLTAGASAPQYVAQSTLSVGSATNATNTAITSSSVNADYYLTVVSANTGNLPQLVASGLTANPSTGKITGGIAGGTF